MTVIKVKARRAVGVPRERNSIGGRAVGFLEELGNPYRAIGRDEAGRMALDWGVYGVPETYVVDGNGKIILRFAGPITQRVIKNTLRPAIEKARGN